MINETISHLMLIRIHLITGSRRILIQKFDKTKKMKAMKIGRKLPKQAELQFFRATLCSGPFHI